MSNNISCLKQSTVAIGVRKIQTISKIKIIHVSGTGFFITDNGVIMTAYHVLKDCERIYKSHRSMGIAVDVVIISYIRKGSKFFLTELPLHKMFNVRLKINRIGYIGPKEVDIGIAIQSKSDKQNKNQFLDINARNSEIFDDLIMCGYPSGESTLDITKKYTGLRFSPVTQFGKIVSFLPYDDVIEPYGVQTDIVSGGGSSGSPIIGSSGKLVGIAQEILLNECQISLYGDASDFEKSFISSSANSKLGLVYGLNARLLLPLVEQIKKTKGSIVLMRRAG